jgi:hypothetical protein
MSYYSDSPSENRCAEGLAQSRALPLTEEMKRLLFFLVLGGAFAAAYFWATAEVPGGEKRYEQFMRQMKDRRGISI